MSRQRECVQRLELYAELHDILSAMKNLAQAELQKLKAPRARQRACLDAIDTALRSSQMSLQARAETASVWLLIGSERGFCGGYNEAVWREGEAALPRANPRVVLVGSKLSEAAGERASRCQCLAGATSSSQVFAVLAAVMEACGLDDESRLPSLAIVSYRDAGVDINALSVPELASDTTLPTAEGVALARHAYLHHVAMALYDALQVENHRRLIQMEGALDHLAEESTQVQRRANQLRQEDIIEEIEIMCAGERFRS